MLALPDESGAKLIGTKNFSAGTSKIGIGWEADPAEEAPTEKSTFSFIFRSLIFEFTATVFNPTQSRLLGRSLPESLMLVKG